MIEQFNKNIFLFLNDLANQSNWLNWLIVLIAQYLPFIFIAILVYLWLSNKKNYRNNALYAGYASIFGLLINFTIIQFYFHPRPFMANLGKTLINHVFETSFPSDHTTFMLSIAATLLFLKETRKVGGLFFAFGIIGGLSRVIAGIHYPLDILGSLFVSLTSALLIVLLKNKLISVNKFIEHIYLRIFKEKA